MAWPTTAVATGDLITATQLNGLPVMIANTTLTGSAATIAFSSIPSHYAHLLLVAYLRSDTGAAIIGGLIRLNSDSAGNYDYQYVLGRAAAASAAETFAATSALLGSIPGSTAGANLFGVVVVDIPHYANSANNKSYTSKNAHKSGTASGNLDALQSAGFWRSNSAISSFYLLPGAGSFVSGSRATLYGLPG